MVFKESRIRCDERCLLNAAAVCVQRYYRGYIARVLTVIMRTEMAQFIALMRVQEAQQDEEMYWQTHPWSRFKRDQNEWWNKRKEKQRYQSYKSLKFSC